MTTPTSTTTGAPGLTPAGLDERIQNLPQELQDEIKDMLIASELPDRFIKIDCNYKPPLGLQIDRKTRENFARKFYKAGIIHYVPSTEFPTKDYHDFLDKAYNLIGLWLLKLNKPHRELLTVIRFNVLGFQGSVNEDWRALRSKFSVQR